jgi:hypothetical protein
MNIRKALLFPVIAAVCTAASAHHSLDAYDSTHVVSLAGVIRRVEIANPHVMVMLEATGADGKQINWMIELTYPSMLKQRSMDLQLLEVGRAVVIESWLRRDGKPAASGRTLVTSDGQRLDVGDSPGWQ